ncbi:MAG: tetratricopeptide repeat protein [Candidatus Polarisedimenticolaceae bacterium]|nr:tetratricopeptide repeat protein [Candidatus Polarisedimenticolaceae bacterium]
MFDTRIHQTSAWFLFISVITAYLVMALWYPLAYIWATYEDLYGEWLQVYLFLLAFLISLYVTSRASRYRWFFVLLALACFYTFMEEISWGQRVFSFASPEFFKSKNLQGETNLHNFLVGPYATQMKAVIEYLLAAALSVYGFLYPLLLRLDWHPAQWLERKGVAAPPFYLAPFFLTAGFFELGILSFNEAEVAEVLVGLAMAIMALHYAFCLRHGLNIHKAKEWTATGGRASRLGVGIIVIPLVAGLASFGSTQALYASSAKRQKIDSRIENGIQKFAGRYTRFEQWDTAVRLRQILHERKPTSLSRLRNLAKAHRLAGNDEAFNDYLNRALQASQKKYQKAPGSTTNNRNMVRVYRMLGNSEKAQFHLQKALRIGQKRVEKRPDSAAAAYSLGQTFALMGRDADAFKQYKRAYEIRPTKSRYRKAYLKFKVRLSP